MLVYSIVDSGVTITYIIIYGGVLVWLPVWGEKQICICPGDANATHYLLLQQIQIGFTFLVPAHLGSPRYSPGGLKTVIVAVVAY